MSAERPNLSINKIDSKFSEFGSDDERDLHTIDTIVVHSMYNPNSETPYSASACKDILDEYEVSSHYLVDRSGSIWQLVPEKKRAWHAGVSQMPSFDPDQRTGVNSFSIGIELIGNETDGFTSQQYESLALLTEDITNRLGIRFIVGHNDIAPDRKTDPWNFDWPEFRRLLSNEIDIDYLQAVGPQHRSSITWLD